MAPTGPGEQAGLLPWIWPDAASFSNLSQRDSSITWSQLRADPGLLLSFLTLELRFDNSMNCTLGEVHTHYLRELLENPHVPWVDWRDPAILPVTRTALSAAHFAELLAKLVGDVDPAQAWAGAWLAFAGFVALGTTDPLALADYLLNKTRHDDPFGAQQRSWGATRAEIAWRLSNKWTLPRWAQVILGRLDLTPEIVHEMDGDRRLQAVVQIAVILAEQAETRLFVSDEFDLAEALAELGVRSTDLEQIRHQYAAECDLNEWLAIERTDPRQGPRLLALSSPAEESNETRIGEVDVFLERVHEAKLASLAEFAAGASHEINNPLAVISGYGQYLLRHETDESKKNALHSIIRQTRRIDSVLTELMYFARPPQPQKEWIELSRLVRESAATVAPLATEREVEIEIEAVSAPLWIDVDPRQLNMAISAIIRNGIEACPAGGWVRVATLFCPDQLEIIVEDSGPGPDKSAQVHLFDPFFSGRAAGRGRGLGLPAAWRLARQHGGDVVFVPVEHGPTRFVLTLPASVAVTAAQRKSA